MIDEDISVERTNAVDPNGQEIFNLNGRTENAGELLVILVALTDLKGPGYVRIENLSKSSWKGKLSCE